MHLLYLDDSGSTGNPNEDYLVLGGVSIYESQAHWITQELDRLAQDIYPGKPQSVEFHASTIFSRRIVPWKGMSREEVQDVIKSVLGILHNSYSARAFACAVHKASYSDHDPMELAFEDLCSRFDRYLGRLRGEGDRQRGLLILDKSAYETTLQNMSRDFRTLGTQWGGFIISRIRLFSSIHAHPALFNSPIMWRMQSFGYTMHKILRYNSVPI